MDNLTEKEISRQRLYSGKIIDLDRITVELPNGKTALREAVVHRGAAAVLPVNDRGEAAMVRQWRACVGGLLLEIPAGKLDAAGEDPEKCAVRELSEETGLLAGNMRLLASFYTTPGFSDERITLYLATDLRQGSARPDDDEFLSVQWIALEELYAMVDRGEIEDSKTLIALSMARYML